MVSCQCSRETWGEGSHRQPKRAIWRPMSVLHAFPRRAALPEKSPVKRAHHSATTGSASPIVPGDATRGRVPPTPSCPRGFMPSISPRAWRGLRTRRLRRPRRRARRAVDAEIDRGTTRLPSRSPGLFHVPRPRRSWGWSCVTPLDAAPAYIGIQSGLGRVDQAHIRVHGVPLPGDRHCPLDDRGG